MQVHEVAESATRGLSAAEEGVEGLMHFHAHSLCNNVLAGLMALFHVGNRKKVISVTNTRKLLQHYDY
jgi:hypothetical protein